MEILLTVVMTALMTYQTTAPEFRHNSLYAFNIDPNDSSIVIMNTQTGHITRCSKELTCTDPDLERIIKNQRK